MHVLDIGCGWGGLALYLAERANVRVHGISLSREQLEVCKSRAAAKGLSGQVTFDLLDYRDITQEYDRIVSVGMFEHVGLPNYACFFEAIARHLAPGGVALVHAIGRAHGPSNTSSWIRKYIFPGGYAPALSEVAPHIEKSGLWIADLEILRLHYAETLRLWRERFLERIDRLPSGCDERFVRMWDYYLSVSEMSFRHFGFMAFQAQLAKEASSVPITRDYLNRGFEQRPGPRLADAGLLSPQEA